MKTPLITQIIAYCQNAQFILSLSPNFGHAFCEFKMDFFKKYQRGIVFSTRFGAEFFDQIIELLMKREYVAAQGEYDQNVNKWLKIVYETN